MELLYIITNKNYTAGLKVSRSNLNNKLVVTDVICMPEQRTQLLKVSVGKPIDNVLNKLYVWNMIDSLDIRIIGIGDIIDLLKVIELQVTGVKMFYGNEIIGFKKIEYKDKEELNKKIDLAHKATQIERLNIRKNYHPLNPLGLDLPAMQINKPETAYYKKIFKLEL